MLIFSEVFEVLSDGTHNFSGPDRQGSLNLTNIPKECHWVLISTPSLYFMISHRYHMQSTMWTLSGHQWDCIGHLYPSSGRTTTNKPKLNAEKALQNITLPLVDFSQILLGLDRLVDTSPFEWSDSALSDVWVLVSSRARPLSLHKTTADFRDRCSLLVECPFI